MGSTDHEAPRCAKNFHTKFYGKKKMFHCRPERESLIRKKSEIRSRSVPYSIWLAIILRTQCRGDNFS